MFRVEEMYNDEKLAVMQANLQKWEWLVKGIMDVDGDSSVDDVRMILPNIPVFRVNLTESTRAL